MLGTEVFKGAPQGTLAGVCGSFQQACWVGGGPLLAQTPVSLLVPLLADHTLHPTVPPLAPCESDYQLIVQQLSYLYLFSICIYYSNRGPEYALYSLDKKQNGNQNGFPTGTE